jgi:UDP-glucose:(heptosyl)LPS alpha-1,3-glucosyltransferase
MRVALVYEHFSYGGSFERERVMLARTLVERGVDVHVYANPDTRTIDLPGVTFHGVRPVLRSSSRFIHAIEYGSFALIATRQLRRERARYDVIDVAGTTAWEHDVLRAHAVQLAEQERWPLRGGKTFRAARVRAFLGPFSYPKTGVARAIERLQYRPQRFRRVLAITDQVRDDLLRVHNVPRELVRVVPYPIDVTDFGGAQRGTVRSKLGVGDEALVLFVGHEFEAKGLAEAIEAVAGLERSPHLAVVGKGQPDRYRQLAQRAGIADRVHFVGPTEQPQEYFADADVFLLPTRHDVWGTVLLEAMAAGVPIVTTDVAGAAAVVQSAQAGFVIPSGAGERLREALRVLLEDGAWAREIGARGRRAAAGFSVEEFGRSVYEEYCRVAEESRS